MVAATHQPSEDTVTASTDGVVVDDAVRAFELLGGRRVIKQSVRNALDAHDVIVRGIPTQALVHLVDNVCVLSSGDTLNKAIGISLRTFQRKKKTEKGKDRLSSEQSSRAWRFAEILAQATNVLGDQATAEAWMLAPAVALNNRRPIDLLSSAAGAEAVADHLTRMEYGVYA